MSGPLEGVRVLELGTIVAGPFAGRLLGDYGADVIKVETPGEGDPMRSWCVTTEGGDSLWWPTIARNKRSVSADLRTSCESGRSLAQSLALWPRCPAGLAEVLGDSERKGDLSPALHMAGDMFEARTRSQGSLMTTVLAILTVVTVVWGIGFVLVALYQPIFNLLTRLA